MLPRRYFMVLGFLAVISTLLLLARLSPDGTHIDQVDDWIHAGGKAGKNTEGKPCTEQLGWLEPYQFSYPIRYVSRNIITLPAAAPLRPSLTVTEKPLFEDFTTVDLTKSMTAEISHCLEPVVLEVPHPSMATADASNIIFGLQTEIGRLRDTVKHLARWLPHTNARLYAIVIDKFNNTEVAANDTEMATLQKQFHDLGMNVTVMHPVKPSDEFPQRYFSLVDHMYGARNEQTQWIVNIDDDTFFPSMHDLQSMLKKYDANEPLYIGSLSEDWWAVKHYGLMGFGGAAILLSVPMAKVIHDHNDECKDHPRTTAGDITIMDCIYRFTTVKLTHIAGLHQVDMGGDLSGFYESGREMLSLHHWKGGQHLEMEKMHLVADICDSCFLQRWQFGKDLVLTNGYSINTYPQGHLAGHKAGILPGAGPDVKKINLEEVEYTWEGELDVLHSLAPTREKMSEESKVTYKLLDSVRFDEEGGRGRKMVRQVYFREGAEKEGAPKEMDTVMVLNWEAGDAPHF